MQERLPRGRGRFFELLVPTLCVGMQIEPLLRFETQRVHSSEPPQSVGTRRKSPSIPLFQRGRFF
jgi:hypothetical protein